MEQSELMVRRIKEGTVIDHIDEGKGLQVLDALRINGQDGSLITLAMNVPSGKSKKKDIIKVENKFLKAFRPSILVTLNKLKLYSIKK